MMDTSCRDRIKWRNLLHEMVREYLDYCSYDHLPTTSTKNSSQLAILPSILATLCEFKIVCLFLLWKYQLTQCLEFEPQQSDKYRFPFLRELGLSSLPVMEVSATSFDSFVSRLLLLHVLISNQFVVIPSRLLSTHLIIELCVLST